MSLLFPDSPLYQRESCKIHFIGCAGKGTCPLAKIFLQKGFSVSGSDLLDTPDLQVLRDAGAVIHIGHSAENLPDDDGKKLFVVHSSAISPDNPELVEARRRGADVLLRGEALALLARCYKRVISISGSHGKTSITSMVVFLLSELGMKPGYLIGDFMVGRRGMNGDCGGSDDLFVSEVDESDGTHTAIASYLGIVPNVEDDHSWSVGGVEQLEQNFQSYASHAKKLIFADTPVTMRLFASHPDHESVLCTSEHPFLQYLDRDVTSCWGIFQKMNALLAMKAVVFLGIAPEMAGKILSKFPGVERRMSVRFHDEKYVLIEDYAHHPTELHASLSAIREIYTDRRLVVVFQPHRYARLNRYFNRFVEELHAADCVFVAPVFAAWTGDGKLDSTDLVKSIGDSAEIVPQNWNIAVERVFRKIHKGDVIAVIGAGDVNSLIPLLVNRLTFA